jgi:hypothetical protein
MSRLMAVSHTAGAVRLRRKTVTRRLGWRFLKVGDRLTLCRKVMGRKPDEPLERLAEVEVISVRREPLAAITDDEVERECVPLVDAHGHERFDEVWIPDGGRWSEARPATWAWVSWFAFEMGCLPETEITRIEWRYLS